MTMIERVARAIYARNNSGDFADAYAAIRTRCLNDASAAIEAMREPTEAIIKAHHVVPDDNDFEERARSNWQAMIDAALTKGD